MHCKNSGERNIVGKSLDEQLFKLKKLLSRKIYFRNWFRLDCTMLGFLLCSSNKRQFAKAPKLLILYFYDFGLAILFLFANCCCVQLF